MISTTIDRPALSASDRCDRCGARAYVRAVLPSGELLFCRHHARQHEARLRAVTVHYIDESARIDEAATSAT